MSYRVAFRNGRHPFQSNVLFLNSYDLCKLSDHTYGTTTTWHCRDIFISTPDVYSQVFAGQHLLPPSFIYFDQAVSWKRHYCHFQLSSLASRFSSCWQGLQGRWPLWKKGTLFLHGSNWHQSHKGKRDSANKQALRNQQTNKTMKPRDKSKNANYQ